jgi:choline dehydrogenase
MAHDVVIVGGGTAGCVLAARLSENPDRRVCLVEAGRDYGPRDAGHWPPEMVDARAMPTTHDWGLGGEDGRSLGARVIGGCSSHNECVVVAGLPADYDEWGPGWTYAELEPYLRQARRGLRTAPRNTDSPSPFHVAFGEAAQAAGLRLLDDPDDPATPTGVAAFPANVVDGARWNAAFAYLDDARGRANLEVVDETLVDRVLVDGGRATGVVAADGRRFEAGTIVLAAGAYFSPAVLCRSGIGPEADLASLGISLVEALPVGELLLDHYGSGLGWEPLEELHERIAAHEREHGLYEGHAVVKAASSSCPQGQFDLHFLSWTNPTAEPDRYEIAVAFFHMKPLSTGRLRLASRDPEALPEIERGFLSRDEDLDVLVEAVEIGGSIAAADPIRELVLSELRPGTVEPERYVRETVRNYFHPAGTCALGQVVDVHCRVFGIDGLYVTDASVMPTIPRANTNLTTAAIAERVAAQFG